MSFDLYLQTFQNGKPAGIPLQAIRSAFGKYVVELDEDFWQVQYSADESSDIFLQPLPDDECSIHTISIHRPCKDIRLWDGLWRLLELSGAVFYYPGCVAPLARDSQAASHMPNSMRESLGDPVMASSVLEIFQTLET
jgi:hypothetical protein